MKVNNNFNKHISKAVTFLLFVLILSSCGGSSSKKNEDSLNYSSLNYESISYSSSLSQTPYYQTLSFSKNILTQNDPSTFQGLVYQGLNSSSLSENDNGSDFLFIAAFENKNINIHVTQEFDDHATAQQVASYYANILGQLPLFLRDGIDEVHVKMGFEPLVGENNALVVHHELADSLNSEGILEEVLIREAVHASLDSTIGQSSEWQTAKKGDNKAISQLAADRSNEDLAESVLAYLAARYRANRIPASVDLTIVNTIPNRIDYFDFSGFVMHPLEIDQSEDWLGSDQLDPSFYSKWEQRVSL